MSKQQSTVLKGIAILMMLCYHLFGSAELTEQCTPLLYIDGEPVARMLSMACYPVSFFLILSGYGLSFVCQQGRLNAKAQLRRLLKLYIHYWLILLIFVTIGYFLRPDIYIIDLRHLAANITGFNCTYNGETWFLLPYAILCLLAVWFVPLLLRIDNWLKVLLWTGIYAAVYVLMKWVILSTEIMGVCTLFLRLLWNLIVCFFYFVLGVVLYRLTARIGTHFRFIRNNWLTLLLLLLIMVVKSQFKVTLADGFYAFAFIVLFLQLDVHPTVTNVLHLLGRHSMPMWMTHTFFAVYLFADFIYGFRYPPLIFVVLVIVCYVTAIPIMHIAAAIIRRSGL